MIIVGQDKENIVNFEKVNIININQSNKKQVVAWFSCNEKEKNNVLLGEYATEERAKEVLQEIINYASVSEINDNYQVADLRLKLAKMCRYEMSKE